MKVPSGIASFPQVGIILPEFLARDRYYSLVQYSDMPRGGHFVAQEETGLLAKNIMTFVQEVQTMDKD